MPNGVNHLDNMKEFAGMGSLRPLVVISPREGGMHFTRSLTLAASWNSSRRLSACPQSRPTRLLHARISWTISRRP